MTKFESQHIARVKALPCAVCGLSGPSEAHHILAGRTPHEKSPDMLTIPLCLDCHQGSKNGIHGQRFMWLVMKKTEPECLAETLIKIYGRCRCAP